MSKLAPVTDSTANLPPETAARYGVRVVQVYVNFGVESFRDYEEMSPARFYEKLAGVNAAVGDMPKTSQPSPDDFRRAYEQCKTDGATAVLSIYVTANASGACASAELAKTMVEGIRVHVVDSATTSTQMSYMLMEARDAVQAGGGVAEALAAVEGVKARSALVFTVTDIEHLTASGRTEGADRVAEAAVKIRPILSVDGGVPKAVAQERTQKAALERVLTLTQEKMGGGTLKRLSIVHGNTESRARQWAAEAAAALGFAGDTSVVDFGPALAVHFGPGLLGVAAQWQ